MKKKNIILLMIASILCIISFPKTYSFYNSSATGDGDVLVAKFKPKLNGSVKLDQTLNLRDYVSNPNYTNTYLEPGTSGMITLSVDFTNVDISSDYSLSLGNYDLPTNLKFYTDENHTMQFSSLDSFNGFYNINDNTTTFSYNLYWYWEEKTDADSIANDTLYTNKDLEVPIIASVNKRVKASYE